MKLANLLRRSAGGGNPGGMRADVLPPGRDVRTRINSSGKLTTKLIVQISVREIREIGSSELGANKESGLGACEVLLQDIESGESLLLASLDLVLVSVGAIPVQLLSNNALDSRLVVVVVNREPLLNESLVLDISGDQMLARLSAVEVIDVLDDGARLEKDKIAVLESGNLTELYMGGNIASTM